jgi:hypothetical protein
MAQSDEAAHKVFLAKAISFNRPAAVMSFSHVESDQKSGDNLE